jgi:hypothetical protein
MTWPGVTSSRGELLQVDAVTALKDVASKHPARWACLPSKSKQAVRVPLLPLRRAELGQTEQGTSRSPAWGQGKEPAALRDTDQLEERYASCCPCGFSTESKRRRIVSCETPYASATFRRGSFCSTTRCSTTGQCSVGRASFGCFGPGRRLPTTGGGVASAVSS